MDSAAFTPASPGRLVRTVENADAFVPGPLPESLEWSPVLASTLSQADRALGRLDGIGTQLPNPHILIDPFLNREAVLSSRIEGTQAALSDLLRFKVAPDVEPEVPDAREVANYVEAMQYGLRRLADLPLSLRLIREVHERLLTGVRGEHRAPGEFRRVQNMIGPPGCLIKDATFVPPPVPEMTTALEAFESYLHRRSELPALVRLALTHYQFEAIHPFLDGNGRVGRLLITLWLCANELLSQPLLYLSAYFEPRREEYNTRLLEVSQKGKWNEWVVFFLRGVAEQAEDAKVRSATLLSLRETFRSRLQTPRGSARALELADQLFLFPYITVRITARLLNVSFSGAQGIIDKAIDAGVLREVTGQPRNRIFVADEIVRAVDD